jgi:hypothetical protein
LLARGAEGEGRGRVEYGEKKKAIFVGIKMSMDKRKSVRVGKG